MKIKTNKKIASIIITILSVVFCSTLIASVNTDAYATTDAEYNIQTLEQQISDAKAGGRDYEKLEQDLKKAKQEKASNTTYDLETTTFNLNQHLQIIKTDENGKPVKNGDEYEYESQSYMETQALKTFIYDKVITPAIMLMGSIAVILIIIGGFTLIAAQGESTGVDKGKEIIKYAIIGLVIALSSYVIVISTQSIFSGNTTTEQT